MLRYLSGPARFLLFGLVALASAQDPSIGRRPKVGVALSGGGARGFAHVGVLAALEDLRVPVDRIAGTSIGGVAAGFYATGFGPARMKALIESVNWENVVLREPPFYQIPYYRKQDRMSYPTDFELGLRGGLTFAAGLNAAVGVNLLISRVVFPYSYLQDFDRLPIPFRAVATNLTDATEVVLGGGSLPVALRATMAIPAFFTPVEWSGMTLVDGGVLNNLPADVVKAMGADFVIAVDVTVPPPTVRELENLLEVANRSLDIVIRQNVRSRLAVADLVIRPDVNGFGTFTFTGADELIARGYAAAMQHAAVLAPYALSEEEWRRYLAERDSRGQPGTVAPQFITVTGADPAGEREIIRQLSWQVGRPMDYRRLHDSLMQVITWGIYQDVLYQQARREGVPGLEIIVTPRRYGPPFLVPGLEVDTSEIASTRWVAKGRVIFRGLGGFGSEWRNDLMVGFRTVIASEYYRPVGRRGWFFAPRAFYRKERQYKYDDQARAAQFRIENAGAGLDIGYEFGRFSQLRVGYEYRHQSTGVRPVQDGDTFTFNGPLRLGALRWGFNNQDSALVPQRGLRIDSAAAWLFSAPGADSGFPMLAANFSQYGTYRNRHTFFVSGALGTAFGSDVPFFQKFTVGGPLQLGAYRLDEFRGNNRFFGAAGYLYRFARLSPLIGRDVAAGGWYEAGSASDNLSDAQLRQDFTGGLVLETRLGTLFLGASFGPDGRKRAYLTLGRFF